MDKDVAVLTDAGRPFQARYTATENTRSPSVDLFVDVTTSDDPQYQHIDGDCRRGTIDLFREDSGMLEHGPLVESTGTNRSRGANTILGRLTAVYVTTPRCYSTTVMK